MTTQTVPRNPSYTSTFDPNTSNANGEGLVATPNVDIATELVATVSAKANYGANAAVIKVDQNLDKTLLDITT